MNLLDLYSCAGGASVGYGWAGFTVDGCDIEERPTYPFAMHHGDALAYLSELIETGEIRKYAAIHASPPCQHGCALTVGTNAAMGWGSSHTDLVGATRELLDASGLPYIIEQPNGRAQMRRDVTLCGEMFGLAVIRHRHFELGNWTTDKPVHKPHRGRVRGWRHGEYFDGPYVAAYGSGGGKPGIPELQEAMGIDWTDNRVELNEAIPPAYTKWLGDRLMKWMS